MKKIFTLMAVVLFAGLGVIGYAYSGLHNVSASSPHGAFADWFLSTTARASIERRAGDLDVPDLRDEALVLAGINDFNSMCVGCHGAPGEGPEAMGRGLNPPAPNLAESAQELTAAELFWVTKHGIRMTGMPAWGVTHDDEAIWPVVAFMTKLPDLDESGYQDMLNAAVGRGHHSDDSASEEHSHVESDDPSDDDIHVHEDGSEHDHGEPTEPEVPAEHDHSTHEHNDD
jgi:mono/diheme cytochrome c family protein